ncbi:hypothetical protein D0Z07_2278 [Hyphodiscus hymeniophilus]|uniref:Uncharacterized protein n=1 Tax=Hyphodiscus hymeniophilus TaxID=353542 RepID=A0A9P6VP95_9HELO|nr:hypothetical protein D0Z07_2278 [Hyphodiscus hymeniophilus]
MAVSTARSAQGLSLQYVKQVVIFNSTSIVMLVLSGTVDGYITLRKIYGGISPQDTIPPQGGFGVLYRSAAPGGADRRIPLVDQTC